MSILTNNGKVFTLGGSIVSYTKPLVPTKGDLINIDLDGNGNKTYRVLGIKDNIAKLLGMSNISTSQAWGSVYSIEVGGGLISQYQGSGLDTYLNTTWYNTLSTEAKSAILPQTTLQDAWSMADWKPKLCKGTTTVGERNAYAPSVQDIVNYIGVDAPSITNTDLWKMFWNTESAPSTGSDVWLLSGRPDYEDIAWFIFANGITCTGTGTEKCVRPVFTIDLSKIPFTKTTEVIS